MVILSGIDSNLKLLKSRKEKYDTLTSNDGLTICKIGDIYNLSKDIETILVDILSIKNNVIFAQSFYNNTSYLKEKIKELIEQKKLELEEIENVHNKKIEQISNIVSYIYSIDILVNSVNVSKDIQKQLFDIRKAVRNIENSEKKICALSYIKNLLLKYSTGLRDILKLMQCTRKKEELSFENKQVLYNIFCSISFDENNSKLHKKVYNEDYYSLEFDEDTKDYLKFYENIFLDNLKCCDIYLHSYYEEINKVLKEDGLSQSYINRITKFIYEKYEFDLSNELDRIKKSRLDSFDDIKRLIASCIDYEGMTNFECLIKDVKQNKKLPNYINDLQYAKGVYYAIDNTNLFNKDIQVYNVIDELITLMYENFDLKEYFKFYQFDPMNVMQQLISFKRCYIKDLYNSRDILISNYKGKIDKLFEDSKLNKYPLVKNNQIVERYKTQISILENCIEYIEKEYNDFTNENYKMYIGIIGKIYSVDSLYELIEKNKKRLMKKMKSTNSQRKETEYLKVFLEDNKLKEEILIELLKSLIDSNNYSDIIDELKNKLMD